MQAGSIAHLTAHGDLVLLNDEEAKSQKNSCFSDSVRSPQKSHTLHGLAKHGLSIFILATFRIGPIENVQTDLQMSSCWSDANKFYFERLVSWQAM